MWPVSLLTALIYKGLINPLEPILPFSLNHEMEKITSLSRVYHYEDFPSFSPLVQALQDFAHFLLDKQLILNFQIPPNILPHLTPESFP